MRLCVWLYTKGKRELHKNFEKVDMIVSAVMGCQLWNKLYFSICIFCTMGAGHKLELCCTGLEAVLYTAKLLSTKSTKHPRLFSLFPSPKIAVTLLPQGLLMFHIPH